MIRKLGLTAAVAMVFAAGLAASALAQGQPASYNDAAKPGGASNYHQPQTIADDAAKPGGASTHQPPIIEGDAAKPGGASTPQPANH